MSGDKNYRNVTPEKLKEITIELEKIMSGPLRYGMSKIMSSPLRYGMSNNGCGVLPSFALDYQPFNKHDPIETHLHAEIEKLRSEVVSLKSELTILRVELAKTNAKDSKLTFS